MLQDAIEFWFDFSSGYAYFAAADIDALADRHGRAVTWRPFMLGVAFQQTGARGLSSTPMKGDYARNDWARLSRRTGLAFNPPAHHPIIALPASRAYYWIAQHAPGKAHAFAKAVFHAYYAEGQDLSEPTKVAALGPGLGVAATDLDVGMRDPAIKAQLKDAGDEAIAKGVFGSPFFIADGEPFWGTDRLAMLDDWLSTGGW